MAERKVVPYLRNKLYHLLDDGRSSKDIAILCSTQKDRDKIQLALESQRSGPRIWFTSAEDIDSDAVVLDSIRRFSGLERNIVILIDPRAHPFQREVEKNLLVGAISRARIQLIVIYLISPPGMGGIPLGMEAIPLGMEGIPLGMEAIPLGMEAILLGMEQGSQ